MSINLRLTMPSLQTEIYLAGLQFVPSVEPLNFEDMQGSLIREAGTGNEAH